MNINNVLTGKGGVGKTLAATVLGCYFQERGQRIECFDVDSNQPSFSHYTSLGVRRMDVTRNGTVDLQLFDGALLRIYGPGAWSGAPRTDVDQVIIDSGSASYLPFVDYMRTEEVLGHFETLGYRHTLHVVLAGGRALNDCLLSLEQLVALFGEQSRIVVWLNDYFDALPWADRDQFVASGAYRKYGHLITGIVRMPDLRPETEGRAFNLWSGKNCTFAEALASSELVFTDGWRLMRIRDMYYDQLDLVFGTVAGSDLAVASE